MIEKLIKDMQANIEKMLVEFNVEGTTGVSYLIGEGKKKEFYGIEVYPRNLYDAIEYIKAIISEDDCDTVSSMQDLFTYTITSNDLFTHTNSEIMDEVKMMFKAYDASIVRYAYESKGVFKQSLKFDYDKEVYILRQDEFEIVANDNFQCLNNTRYDYTSKNGTIKCRWHQVGESKEYPVVPVSMVEMIDIIAWNAQFQENSEELDHMSNVIEWLGQYQDSDANKVYWSEDLADFVTVDATGVQESYLGFDY